MQTSGYADANDRVWTRGYAPFSNNLSPPVTLKMGSRSPKSNQHFSPSQWYICASLAICPFNKEIECRQVATPMPTGSALKTICPPPHTPWWRDIIATKVMWMIWDLNLRPMESTVRQTTDCAIAPGYDNGKKKKKKKMQNSEVFQLTTWDVTRASTAKSAEYSAMLTNQLNTASHRVKVSKDWTGMVTGGGGQTRCTS